MYDQSLFLQTLSRFAVVLPTRYDVDSTLTELTERHRCVGPHRGGAVLADVATSYVVNASKLRQQLTEQLQKALESRAVIEQAKGITAQQQAVTIDQAYQRMRGARQSQQRQHAGGRRGDRGRWASSELGWPSGPSCRFGRFSGVPFEVLRLPRTWWRRLLLVLLQKSVARVLDSGTTELSPSWCSHRATPTTLRLT